MVSCIRLRQSGNFEDRVYSSTKIMMMEDDEDAEEELWMQNCSYHTKDLLLINFFSYHTKDLLLINRAQEFQQEGNISHRKNSHKAHDHELYFNPRRPKITLQELVCTSTKTYLVMRDPLWSASCDCACSVGRLTQIFEGVSQKTQPHDPHTLWWNSVTSEYGTYT